MKPSQDNIQHVGQMSATFN